MTDVELRNDEEFRTLFREHAPPVADAGFSARIVRRVRRQRQVRLLTLTLATAAGLLLALAPLNRLLAGLDAQLSAWLDGLQRTDIGGGLGAVVEALQVREMLAALGEQLTGALTLSTDAAWLADHQPLIMAVVLALVGTLGLRALAR